MEKLPFFARKFLCKTGNQHSPSHLALDGGQGHWHHPTCSQFCNFLVQKHGQANAGSRRQKGRETGPPEGHGGRSMLESIDLQGGWPSSIAGSNHMATRVGTLCPSNALTLPAEKRAHEDTRGLHHKLPCLFWLVWGVSGQGFFAMGVPGPHTNKTKNPEAQGPRAEHRKPN